MIAADVVNQKYLPRDNRKSFISFVSSRQLTRGTRGNPKFLPVETCIQPFLLRGKYAARQPYMSGNMAYFMVGLPLLN
ncbi:MAG: hypothetical protein R3231_12705, partial [bacterium]|nr:hypothetical protein [bacterium]